MLLDSTIFPDLVDTIVRASSLDGLCTWRGVSRYHRTVVDRILFNHVHVYERAAYTTDGATAGGFAVCSHGVRWPFWSWSRDGTPSNAILLPPPFKYTNNLDISWQGASASEYPVPTPILDLFEPNTIRLVAFRGAYPALEWRWPKARLISFVDVSTTKQRGGRETRVEGPKTSTMLHLKYDARRNEFFRLLALSYIFPVFKPTPEITIIISPDRPGPELACDRRKMTAQVLKRVGYWILYGDHGGDKYHITVVVDGLEDNEELAEEPRASAIRAAGDKDVAVPTMSVSFVTHDEYRAQLGSDAALHYDWPRQPGERLVRRGSGTLWVL
ncbi:hypothetical protein CcaverHIS002_0408080 [Cutaneotrichosporon cavernicola]|uniref:Uncharacterized protein n=1 Tax=Cutaneotrichosporon cavernicola TaxID=279322 RepID=A0AA48L4T6_9TREE|nr:uncharacterized protein CcaverHIS019_0408060 [Cutaneotrichosporon cavernicola]BEI84204.1 hypothetical protein CcaverHIS002_0408080 [Cutaneotrichosporon cavernicola]BEI91986.1 hypothetical protein CcaverHIS019_0408060 [Cutaneotrichosporon cavernicola]BEI99757.1 hypothetical protein CcaverHIS631_0408000 [Cutaneotrichosporon cavernicola]BEJ07533.1 hypothetical protein CcaverHIS641_0408020 [Cutaneotrichosporon cavernicola]